MPSSASPQSTILNVCDEFLGRIRNHTEVKEGFERFNQRIRQEFGILMQNIQETRPRFVLDLQAVVESSSPLSSENEENEDEDVIERSIQQGTRRIDL